VRVINKEQAKDYHFGKKIVSRNPQKPVEEKKPKEDPRVTAMSELTTAIRAMLERPLPVPQVTIPPITVPAPKINIDVPKPPNVNIGAPKPTNGWEFTVRRDSDGYIKTIEAKRIEGGTRGSK